MGVDRRGKLRSLNDPKRRGTILANTPWLRVPMTGYSDSYRARRDEYAFRDWLQNQQHDNQICRHACGKDCKSLRLRASTYDAARLSFKPQGKPAAAIKCNCWRSAGDGSALRSSRLDNDESTCDV